MDLEKWKELIFTIFFYLSAFVVITVIVVTISQYLLNLQFFSFIADFYEKFGQILPFS